MRSAPLILLLGGCAATSPQRGVMPPVSVALRANYFAISFEDVFDREVQALLVRLAGEEENLRIRPAEDDDEGSRNEYQTVKRCKRIVDEIYECAGRPREDRPPRERTDRRRTVEHLIAALCAEPSPKWIDLYLLEIVARAVMSEANAVVLTAEEWCRYIPVVISKIEAAPQLFGSKYDIRATYQMLAVETVVHGRNGLAGKPPPTPNIEKNAEFDRGMAAYLAWMKNELPHLKMRAELEK